MISSVEIDRLTASTRAIVTFFRPRAFANQACHAGSCCRLADLLCSEHDQPRSQIEVVTKNVKAFLTAKISIEQKFLVASIQIGEEGVMKTIYMSLPIGVKSSSACRLIRRALLMWALVVDRSGGGVALASRALFLTLAASHAEAADVYSSRGSDGVERWSTQPLNASYRVAFAIPNSSTGNDLATSTNFVPNKGKSFASSEQLAQRRNALYPLIEQIARHFDVDIALVMGLIEVESGFNAAAVSPKGARGLMQLMPTTARLYGLRDVQELHQPARNLEIGIRHLKDLLAVHGNHQALALASYNAGQGAVKQHGQRIPRYHETMLYVPAVLSKAARFSAGNSQSVTAATANPL